MRRKLIEVALRLDAVDAAAAREKSIRHGHPSMLRLWWARRPLAAARACGTATGRAPARARRSATRNGGRRRTGVVDSEPGR